MSGASAPGASGRSRSAPARIRADGHCSPAAAWYAWRAPRRGAVTGLPLGPDALAALAAELKKRCGAGGTLRDGVIEIQGEHRDTLVAELVRRGFDARRAGG
jgi:translation initiation factor 1